MFEMNRNQTLGFSNKNPILLCFILIFDIENRI